MLSARMIVSLAGLMTLAACSINPVPVVGEPGPTKDIASFQKDEAACRAEAGHAAYGTQGTARPVSGNTNVDWQDFFTTYAKCQTAHGNFVQPVPWAVAYAVFLGYGQPPYPPVLYPAPYVAPPMYGYP